MRNIGAGLALVCLLLFMTATARAEACVERINHRGWEGAYRLFNKTTELVFVPQIGRIMRYGYIGGANVLWENPDLLGKLPAPAGERKDWANFGGDKLWPAPQDRWNWPPDPALDGSPHTVEILSGNRLRVTSPASAASSIQFEREIGLAASGTVVTLRNRMRNIGAQPVAWSVWEVAQVDDPEHAEFSVYRKGRFPQGHYTFPNAAPEAGMLSLSDGIGRLRRSVKQACKIGGDSPQGWLASVKNGVRFQVSASYERGRLYPDEGCGQEIYTNPDPLKYVELELLGPMVTLAPGKNVTFTTRWSLSRLRD